ncbi:MAG: Cell division protein FtsL [Candidatus Moanabacter tarae]|uniref:Cell division protein FtsL n=1 Tax=Candidatus Moanibacter tarae TaxID=2200854 RepID=A0A2Z4ADA5_9BACT|nr:MAG: Cell division protein FtsL [Candidatus Moanabacter tarae]|tara:strand:- start:4760 stop:5188 length:429 start_codon:yes stop_codon:yes gene_type:complete
MDKGTKQVLDREETSLFLYRTLILVVLTLMVAIGCGLIVVWQRRQISESALRSAEYERQLEVLKIRIQDLNAETASMHQPERLRKLNEKFGLKLAWPVEEQTFYILHEKEVIDPIRKTGRKTGDVSFGVALVELGARKEIGK